jgi:hypothetical protein
MDHALGMQGIAMTVLEALSLLSPRLFAIFRPLWPRSTQKVYIVSFRTYDNRRPSKFIVLADNMKAAIMR